MGAQKKALILLLLFVSSTIFITEIKVAKADSGTLVVPDDYPTIASALGNATDGDIIFMKRGTYDGPRNQTLAIDKTVSIIGEDPEDVILNLHPNYTELIYFAQIIRSDPDAIRIEANDVRLLNLTLNFIGEIRVTSNKVQIIDNNIRSHSTVRGIIVNGYNCTITSNSILGQITLEGSSSHTIHQNNLYFVRLESANSSIIKSNAFRFLYVDSSHNNIISRNSINTENLGYAISIQNSTNNIFHDNNVTVTVWNNNLRLTMSQNNTFYNNAFIDVNDDPHVILDMSSTNIWDNGTTGNYWSNYNGTDNDGNRIGDAPYIINENNQDNHPLMNTTDIEAIPEFPPWIILPLSITTTLAAIIVKKKLIKNCQACHSD